MRSLTAVRVLVVDDFEPWRRFVVGALRDLPDIQIVGEAADGLDAVQKAAELRPDLVLLDLGLPRLNGMAAAREIRSVVPEAKILFVSQESSPAIVQEAVAMGAGYVVKADAASELVKAMNAARNGRIFVGSRFAAYDFTIAENARRRAAQSATEGASLAMRNRHDLLLYSEDDYFLDKLARFIESVLREQNAIIVVATAPHREDLLSRLQAKGLNVGAAIRNGRYVPLDSAEVLSAFMTDGLPDEDRFFRIGDDLMGAAKKAAAGEHPRVAACGECAPYLWAQGNAEAALRTEQLWDQLCETHGTDLLCGYPRDNFREPPGRNICEQIRAEHSVVHSF